MCTCRAWLVTSRGIARKIKNSSSCLSSHQFIREDAAGAEANMKCPNCNHLIDDGDGDDVAPDWPGFPAGVKFEPSDVELMEHLAARIGLDDSNPPHILIDEFIPMLEDVAGICYTHPQNLPGAKKDGSSVHFFHRVSNAYGKGPRKRRRISRCGSSEEQARWHKTGKTKRVFRDNGVQKGWKKIMVLYANAKGASRPGKAKWVMHQYHIGAEEDELEGQLMVSKVFYQQQPAATRGEIECGEETEMQLGAKVDPRTPNTSTPQPPRLTEDSPKEEDDGNSLQFLLNQCHEHSFLPVDSRNDNDISAAAEAISTAREFSDLDDILIDTHPDFQLADLQFGSQESTMSWLDKLLETDDVDEEDRF